MQSNGEESACRVRLGLFLLFPKSSLAHEMGELRRYALLNVVEGNDFTHFTFCGIAAPKFGVALSGFLCYAESRLWN